MISRLTLPTVPPGESSLQVSSHFFSGFFKVNIFQILNDPPRIAKEAPEPELSALPVIGEKPSKQVRKQNASTGVSRLEYKSFSFCLLEMNGFCLQCPRAKLVKI